MIGIAMILPHNAQVLYFSLAVSTFESANTAALVSAIVTSVHCSSITYIIFTIKSPNVLVKYPRPTPLIREQLCRCYLLRCAYALQTFSNSHYKGTFEKCQYPLEMLLWASILAIYISTYSQYVSYYVHGFCASCDTLTRSRTVQIFHAYNKQLVHNLLLPLYSSQRDS